jgi:glutamate dehydrogenase (NADP+)
LSQNSARIAWDESQLADMLQSMMKSIHDSCVEYGQESEGNINYLQGANVAGFVKVAEAMLSYGHV